MSAEEMPKRSFLPESLARFVVREPPRPAYLALLESGELERRVERALAELERCAVCPRACGVDRAGAAPGEIPKGAACSTGRHARISTAFAHFGEEDVLRGWRGSGTIFVSRCNLRCVFCQNWDISHAGEGREMGPQQLAGLMLDLQRQGCHNINIVTPEHVVPQMLEALLLAARGGLELPLVYNTSAYDSVETLRLLDGVVDIYMPDFKYRDAALAKRYLKAADYPEAARAALREMHRQVGVLTVNRRGVAVRGVLVRHLVMPGGLDDSRLIFRFLAQELSPDTFVNVMGQYGPAGLAAERGEYPELSRRPTAGELREAEIIAGEEGLWRFDERYRSESMFRR